MVKSACVKTARAPSGVHVINLYIDAYSTEWFLHCKFTKLHIIKSEYINILTQNWINSIVHSFLFLYNM